MKKFLMFALGLAVIVGGITLIKRPKAPDVENSYVYEPIQAVDTSEVAETKVDRIHQLFTTGKNKLPIVETVSYSPRVDWLEGRAAWIADYASFYGTSRHFIARSLNRKADYFTQKVSHGDRFNVFNKNKNFEFNLLVDLSKCDMHFYYTDLDTGEKTLLKTYKVGLGRQDRSSPSGSLTPTGKYLLGEKVGIYKAGVISQFQDNEAEMIQIFGTRWIPFGEELEECTMDARGYGLHGNPWLPDTETGELKECRETIGSYESDGCIRLNSEDIEELFSIIVSNKQTTIEIVPSVGDLDAIP